MEPCNGEAQAVLDELSALMQAGSIRVSPLSCLRGLARRVGEGTFVPEAGIKVRERRDKRQVHEQQAKPDTSDVLRQHARMLGVPEDEYLQRMGRS